MAGPAKITRRQFLRITASAGALLAGGSGLASLSNRTAAPLRVQESRIVMGSMANLTLLSDDSARARQAIRAAFERMDALENVLSRFRPQSQLSLLNQRGSLEQAASELREVLQRAITFGHLTNGAFDISIEPVSRLYREGVLAGRLPVAHEIAEARERVDYRQIEISGSSVRLLKAGMALTLDGIGKGYIIDQGAAALREHGFTNVLVEIGGDLSSSGDAGGRPWRAGIRQPGGEGQTTVAQLQNMALATSGDYLNTFTPDRVLNHILNPASGVSPLDLASASVTAPSACDADALATALMVMGREYGFALIEHLKDVEALVVSKAGEINHTSHFPLAV